MSFINYNNGFNHFRQLPDGLKKPDSKERLDLRSAQDKPRIKDLAGTSGAAGVSGASGCELNIDELAEKINSGDLAGAINDLNAASVPFNHTVRDNGFDIEFDYNGIHYEYTYVESAGSNDSATPIHESVVDNHNLDDDSSVPIEVSTIGEVSDVSTSFVSDFYYSVSTGDNNGQKFSIDSREQNYSKQDGKTVLIVNVVNENGESITNELLVDWVTFDEDGNLTSLQLGDMTIALESEQHFDTEAFNAKINELQTKFADSPSSQTIEEIEAVLEDIQKYINRLTARIERLGRALSNPSITNKNEIAAEMAEAKAERQELTAALTRLQKTLARETGEIDDTDGANTTHVSGIINPKDVVRPRGVELGHDVRPIRDNREIRRFR